MQHIAGLKDEMKALEEVWNVFNDEQEDQDEPLSGWGWRIGTHSQKDQ